MALRDQIRVMVVDDMSTSRGLLVQALEGFGIKSVAHAPDGPTALQLLERSPVHLIISDFNMPKMDGLQLLHALRTNNKTKMIGFILITGRAERQIIENGKKLGMNNFIKKPFQPNDLRTCIESVVGRL
ncbi:response regulator [Mangrovicoccus algicola]|uniref:Response regulator n=1 Tax=Mangrovicoccus algicola TaxID=2771008 RepID=A0A8J7CVS7_9RHOB|nr:response regulator [Mangrovicoccus algicola]MBE3639089.1 response regulator [Mangrovicoccus algicola]